MGRTNADERLFHIVKQDAESRSWTDNFALNLIEENGTVIVSVYFLSVRKDSVCQLERRPPFSRSAFVCSGYLSNEESVTSKVRYITTYQR